MIHQIDPHALPDSDFEPGRLEHVVVGNRGRLLDPRRTPVSIAAINPGTGHVHFCIEAFEDRGALWEIPFERISSYQLERNSNRAPQQIVLEYQAISERLNQPLVISRCDRARAETEARVSREA